MSRLAAAQSLRVSLRAAQETLVARLGHLDDLSGEITVSRALVLLDGRVDKSQESHMFVLYIATQRQIAWAQYKREELAARQAHKLGR
jgi:hypothetical protein